MMSSVMHSLIVLTVVSSLAVFLVALLRKPLRYPVGSRAAYWIWLLVPALTSASLLPRPSDSVQEIARSLPPGMSVAYSAVMVSMDATLSSSYTVGMIVVWLMGAVLGRRTAPSRRVPCLRYKPLLLANRRRPIGEEQRVDSAVGEKSFREKT